MIGGSFNSVLPKHYLLVTGLFTDVWVVVVDICPAWLSHLEFLELTFQVESLRLDHKKGWVTEYTLSKPHPFSGEVGNSCNSCIWEHNLIWSQGEARPIRTAAKTIMWAAYRSRLYNITNNDRHQISTMHMYDIANGEFMKK